ncbi:Sugar kinase of the NBD/HSP70 family, may contain an N-terminal HTH domain [Streptosporangium subroseum]|uniref:Sugar kinase of the NBD/HSP70 family, may contain an N-terminal HTH domain n=1 Tax=Streptosporangium subroseum TaxID=106412 RepID=A0A239GM60_9ACTN|nr:ROK family transcriptional regulator [Streptosporangium subroseum]SNS70210.1 Sugar kinase of the NBD/HSP70 family, may contain an N-terminal HTH domain [Streptosporangium subroseum]
MPRRPATALATSGEVLRLIRTGEASTRADIGRVTGLSRPAVSLRVTELLDRRLVVEDSEGPSTGGRPPTRLVFNASGGVVLVASLGASRAQIAVCDLAGTVLARTGLPVDVEEGPDVVLPLVMQTWSELLGDRPLSAVRGVGMGVPATVEFAAGRTESARIMAGWTGVAVPPIIAARFPAPVFLDNDVNVIAIGEHREIYAGEADDLLFIKISTRIGSGVIAGGEILRGALGAAGEIGHIPVRDGGGVLCRCGNIDCVDSVASGTAILRDLRARGHDVKNLADVVALVRAGDAETMTVVRNAARMLGEVVASAVNLLNPAVVVLGGDVAETFQPMVSGVREVVHRRSTALATRNLRIERSRLGPGAGIIGCAHMVLDHILSPDAIDSLL